MIRSIFTTSTVVAIAAAALAGGSPAAAAEPTPYGTRPPRTCEKVRSVPTVPQIQALVQCNFEYTTSSAIALLEDVKVEVGGMRAYNALLDANASGIDTDAKVMPIRGSMVQYNCSNIKGNPGSEGHNCSVVRKPRAEGKCYKTTFGDWACGMSDAYDISGEYRQPPPAAH